MENKILTEKSTKIMVIVFLVLFSISLAFNIYAAVSIFNFKKDVAKLNKEVTRSQETLSKELGDAVNLFRSFLEEQQSLVTPLKSSLGRKSGDEQRVVFSFQVKDYQSGTSAVLYLKEPDATEFNDYRAVHMGRGRFRVEIKEKIVPDPQIYVRKTSQEKDVGVKKVREEDLASRKYTYYLEIKQGGQVTTTKEAQCLVPQIENKEVAPLEVLVAALDQKSLSVTVREVPEAEAKLNLSEVFLVGEKGSRTIFKESFWYEEVENGEKVFVSTLEKINPRQLDSLYLLLKYDRENVQKLLPKNLLE